MSLFEIYGERKIEIQPTEKAFPAFKKVSSLTEILNDLDGEVILIVENASRALANWIRRHQAPCSLYTTKPRTIEELDAINDICEICPVFIISAIDLNYIHCGNILYIVPNRFSDSAAANVVMLAAMSKKEIDTQIAIDIDGLAQQLALTQAITSGDDGSQTGTADNQDVAFTRDDYELELLREEITRLMNDCFCIVKTEIANASVERRTIALTPFYKKNGVAQGKLRGTWQVFDESDIPKIMDSGIVRRALEKVNKEYTVTVKSAYKLIRKDKLPEYKRDIEKIEKEYRGYLRGENKGYVGTEKIKVQFTPAEVVKASIDELSEYLHSISGSDSFEYEVEQFAWEQEQKLMDSFADVCRKTVITALSKEQLEERDYVYGLHETAWKNTKFFGKDLFNLIERYAEALHKRDKTKHN